MLRKPDPLAVQIDRVANRAIESGESVGLQIAVLKGGRPILVKGYGFANLEHDALVTDQTVFRVASVTKQFTAAAILMLAERGELSLDDSLAKTLPDFPRAQEVKIRHLLGHTSGIHNFTDPANGLPDCPVDQTAEQRVAAIAALPNLYDFDPGTRWSYSNSGYYLLGAIVQKVTGEPLGVFLQQHIFRKLGMSHTAMDDEAEIVKHRAAGYEAPPGTPLTQGSGNGDPKNGSLKNSAVTPSAISGGAGALRSTAQDLAKWHDVLFNGRVLQAESLRQMTASVRLNDGRLASSDADGVLARMKQSGAFDVGFGLTLQQIEGHEKIGHGGGMPGFAASVNTYTKEGITVVVLSNTTGGPAGAGVANVAPAIERIALGIVD